MIISYPFCGLILCCNSACGAWMATVHARKSASGHANVHSICLRVWALRPKKEGLGEEVVCEVLRPHGNSRLSSLDIASTGDGTAVVVSGGHDGFLRSWTGGRDSASWHVGAACTHRKIKCNAVAIAPDGSLTASTHGSVIALWAGVQKVCNAATIATTVTSSVGRLSVEAAE